MCCYVMIDAPGRDEGVVILKKGPEAFRRVHDEADEEASEVHLGERLRAAVVGRARVVGEGLKCGRVGGEGPGRLGKASDGRANIFRERREGLDAVRAVDEVAVGLADKLGKLVALLRDGFARCLHVRARGGGTRAGGSAERGAAGVGKWITGIRGVDGEQKCT